MNRFGARPLFFGRMRSAYTAILDFQRKIVYDVFGTLYPRRGKEGVDKEGMNEASSLFSYSGENGVKADRRDRDESFVMSGSHSHLCYELMYVDSGSCHVIITGNVHEMHEGDFLLIPPSLSHSARFPSGICRRTVVLFREEDAGEEALSCLPIGGGEQLSGPVLFHTPASYRHIVGTTISKIIAEERIEDERSIHMRKELLRVLLMECSRVCLFQDALPMGISATDPHVLRAAQYITAHYTESITTEDIADAVNFSPNYLSRIFRRNTGMGLHEYLIYIRMYHAALELVTTDDPVAVIAQRCGFSDSNYFKDAFKKHYGMSPRDYRKKPKE